jgi:hypothetical protein
MILTIIVVRIASRSRYPLTPQAAFRASLHLEFRLNFNYRACRIELQADIIPCIQDILDPVLIRRDVLADIRIEPTGLSR